MQGQEVRAQKLLFNRMLLDIGCASTERIIPNAYLGCVYLMPAGICEATYGPCVRVLPCALHSDETCVTLAGADIHPIILSLYLPSDIMSRQHTHQRIAFLPILAAGDVLAWMLRQTRRGRL